LCALSAPQHETTQTTNVSDRGNAPALTDIVAGHLPTMFSNLSDALAHLASGAIRALAVSSDKRTPQLPNMPTVAESGFPRLQRDHLERTDGGPAGTPATSRNTKGASAPLPKFVIHCGTL
jgi:tripartite-type tricarboxylate transporter receptor subunit TctC